MIALFAARARDDHPAPPPVTLDEVATSAAKVKAGSK
jgi:hypothetical protein